MASQVKRALFGLLVSCACLLLSGLAEAVGPGGGNRSIAQEAPSNTPAQAEGESNVVVDIPRSQWCQCVRGLLNVEGGNAGACVKSGVSEEKLRIFKNQSGAGGRSNSVSFLLSFAGCKEEENENVGSLSFNIAWLNPDPAQPAAKPSVPVACEAAGIATIEATIYRASGKKLASVPSWQCSKPMGALHHIPAAANLRFIVIARSANGSVLYRGERAGIQISYAKTTALGTVYAPAFTPVPINPKNDSLFGNGRVAYSWSAPAGALKYEMQVSTDAQFASKAVSKSLSLASFKTGTTNSLATGTYFWRVKAADEFNNNSEWSTPSTFTVDNDPPINTTGKQCINKGAAATNSRSVTLSISGEKKRGGVTGYYLSESSKRPDPNRTGWVSVPPTLTYAADVPFTLSKHDGKKQVYVWLKDGLGHVSQVKDGTIIVDTKMIRTTITSHPSLTTTQVSADFTFVANKPAASFRCKLDEAAYSSCTGSGSASYQDLSPGMHTFSVQASDKAGNIEQSPPVFTWTIDTTVPHATITSHPDPVTSSLSADFTFVSDKPGSRFQCRIDQGDYTACDGTASYRELTPGTHIFTVLASDTAGNVDPSPPSYNWTIDIVPLRTTITSHPSDPSNSPDAEFRFVSNKSGVSFQCRLDNGNFESCESPQNYSGLTPESHTFTVKAVDAGGTEDANPPQYTWLVTFQQPAEIERPRPIGISAVLDGAPVPGSPAIMMSGVFPQIIQPVSPRELQMSVLESFDAGGNPELGVAVDMAPYVFFNSHGPLQQYRDSRQEQELSKIQVSLSFTKASGDVDSSKRMGTALHWTIRDDGDIRMDNELVACLERMDAESESVAPPESGYRLEDMTAEKRAKICRNESLTRNWNRFAVDVGAAAYRIENAGNQGASLSDGFGLWSSLSYGFDRFPALKDDGQLVLQVQYRSNQVVPDPAYAAGYHTSNFFSLGGKFRWREDAARTLFFQAIVRQTKPEGQKTDLSYIFSLGADVSLNDNIWIEFEMGTVHGYQIQDNSIFLTATLKAASPARKRIK